MSSFFGSLTNIGTAIGVGGIISSTVFGLLAARNKVTIQSLESTVRAYKEQFDAQQLTIKTRDATIVDRNKQLELVEEKARVLESIVTQAPAIAQMSLDMTRQHKETQKTTTKVITAIGDMTERVTKELSRLAQAIDRRSQ